jgi:hypothetical protein
MTLLVMQRMRLVSDEVELQELLVAPVEVLSVEVAEDALDEELAQQGF